MRDLTLQDFPFLTSLAASESARDRRIWLRVASDHFVATDPDDPAAIERFADVMAAQLAAADPATRLEIAQKLARSRRTPIRLLASLEASGPEVSDYVLAHAAAYTGPDLAEAVARGARQAIAVARREDLDARLVSLLASHDDVEVLVALARNSNAPLEPGTLVPLLRRARAIGDHGDTRLAEALLDRRPVRAEAALLFLLASPDQRVAILLAAQRMQLGRAPRSPLAATPAVLDELEMAAVARQPARFVAALAQALDCEPDLAQAIVDDASGEPLAVALAALGAANDVIVRVLISNDLMAGAAYERIRTLARLQNALDPNAATMVVAALRDGAVMRRRRQPLADGRVAAEASRPAPARGAHARAEPQPRMRAK